MAQVEAVLDLKQWGNNLGVRLPVNVARSAHLSVNQRVRVSVEDDGRIIITPFENETLKLEQRLALFDPVKHGGETMTSKLDENDKFKLKNIADLEGRNEQEIIRDSLRMYLNNANEQREFIASVERGWYELRSGLGEVVTENDTFFDSIRAELCNEKPSA